MKIATGFGTLIILSAIINSCMCVIYSSPYYLERLLSSERKLIEKIQTYIDQQTFNKVKFDEGLLSFIDLAKEKNIQRAFDRDLDTPLTSYHLLKRIVKQWEEVKRNMSCTETAGCPLVTGEEVINNVWKKEDDKPTEEDLQAAALAIINVFSVYNMSLEDMVAGNFSVAADDPLSADDVIYIADVAKQHGKTYEAIRWLEFLLSNLKDFPTHEFKVSTLYKRLAGSYHEHGVTTKAVEILTDYLKTSPDDTKISRDLEYFKSRAKTSKLSEVLRFQDNDVSKRTQQRKIYERLCQTGAKEEYQTTNLTCQLVPLQNYYGRAKVEILSMRPKIGRYHDVLNKTEMAEWRGYGNVTYGHISNHFPSAEYSVTSPQAMRSTAMCEGNRIQYPLLRKATKRLEQMTRFHLTRLLGIVSSLCYETTNEGVGGYQRPVTDYRPPVKMQYSKTPFLASGNKMATVILQLSEVAYGGGIVFPRADLHVPVVEGSAVVIWNLKETGQPDPRSLRINCPVVVGSKWTALKHVFHKNQIFRRPCEAQN